MKFVAADDLANERTDFCGSAIRSRSQELRHAAEITAAACSRRATRGEEKREKKKKKKETDVCFCDSAFYKHNADTTGRSTVRDANFYADVQYVRVGEAKRVFLFVKREGAFRNETEILPAKARLILVSQQYHRFVYTTNERVEAA